MAITLLRHAALPKEQQGCYLGWSDVGIDEDLFDEKKAARLRTNSFALVFSSDLKRCRQTLEKLGKDFTIDSRLREVRFKAHIEGKRFNDIEKLESYDSKHLESQSSWHSYICQESEEAFRLRLEEFLASLPADKEILICSHAGSIRMMMEILQQPKVTLDYLEYRTYTL